MLYSDGNGFPLAVKPSHLYGSTERMDVAEILSAIVEQACLYVPDVPVGETMPKLKIPKGVFNKGQVPKEALTDSEKASPNEALSVVKVPVAASNLVRSKLFELACFKVIVCQLVLFGLICNL